MSHIRPIAVAVPRRGDDLLVCEYHDPTRDLTFYRPLGGGIEFGETAAMALRRELREELGTELHDVTHIGVLESLFHGFGRDGHEIVFVFGARLADPSLYERDVVGKVLDEPTTTVMWRPLHGFTAASPLYPDGLVDLIAG